MNSDTIRDKIVNKSAIIGVVGLGYVGLPLAVSFAETGFCVEGYDAQPTKVWRINKGESYIADVPNTTLAPLVRTHRLRAIIKLPSAWKADVVIICVPTPITEDKKPDLSYITEAVNQIKGRLASQDSMVILESSTYPGTTRDVVLPLLAETAKYVAYSPERVDPGSKKFNIRNTPKLVGGIDKESTELATLLYEQIVDKVVPVSSPEVAEMAKLFENVFRNVNIALVNEMALICEIIGVSVWEMIDVAATKPFGFMPFYPGVGVGGHCIPVDPYYLVDKAMQSGLPFCSLISTALSTNEEMPEYVANQIEGLLKQGVSNARIMVLGVAFKRDISDIRESPSVKLIDILLSWGADVSYNDPYVPEVVVGVTRLLRSSPLDEIVDVDCVVIATNHSCYDYRDIVLRAKMVFDTRGATRGIKRENIRRLGEKG